MSDEENDFKKLCSNKQFSSLYSLSQQSHLKLDHLTHIAKGRVAMPREETLQKIATAFAQKNKTSKDQELKEIKIFFERRRNQLQLSQSGQKSIDQDIKWTLILDKDISNDPELSKILAQLEKLGGGMIWVNGVKKGSTILSLESSVEVFERINNLYVSGDLDNLLDVSVLDLHKDQVNLTQWLAGIFTETWEDVRNLLTEQQLAIAHFADQVKLAKRLDLRIDLITKTIILVVNIDRENSDKIVVTLQLYPTDGDRILPEGLKLIVLAEGEVFEEVTARSADQLMQCRFDAETGDQFTLELRLGEAVIREDFEV